MTDYASFLATKMRRHTDAGIDVDDGSISDALFPFQRALVRWALRKGRAAILADTGLGKTRMQLEWARLVPADKVLILAPLAVTEQTVAEGRTIHDDVTYVRDQTDADGAGRVVISNYDRLHLFDPARFDAVVLDESSILKAFSGSTKRALVAAFRDTPYKLCCSATPAPNDIEELCNHADFLGVMTPAEMRSTFFIADSRGEFMRYRLKGHAHDAFYQWMSSWAAAVRMPSDLGFPDDGYVLPELGIQSHFIGTSWAPDGKLFADRLEGVTERSSVRKETLDERVAAAVKLIDAEPGERWLVWCGLNAEASAVLDRVPDAVEVAGADTAEDKTARLLDFAAGNIRVLVTKPSIAGQGLNFQSCARMVFVGLSDSYESYYQAIRRCWRFGQTRPVTAHIVLSEPERPIYANVLDKERQARELTAGLIASATAATRRALFAGTSKGDDYEPSRPLTIPSFMEAS